MNRTRNFTLIAFFAAAGLAVLSGCKSDNPSSPPADSLVKPKQGSTYTFATYDTDSLDRKVASSDASITFTVGATGVQIANRTDCYRIDPSDPEEDTIYVNYASNGDVALYYGMPADEFAGDMKAWINLPFGSRTEATVTLVDTTIDDGMGGTMPLKVESTTKFIGNETASVGAGSFNTQKAQWILKVSMQLFGFPVVTTSTTNIWFAPKIGYIVKLENKSEGGIPGLGASKSGHVETLSSYTLQ